MIENYFQPVIEEFTQGKFFSEVQKAREEFFSKTGKINEDDKFFENRMSLFLDWYIFDRKMSGTPHTPMKTFYIRNKDKLSEENLKIYRGMANHIHSIFTITTFKGNFAQVLDLASQKTYLVNPGSISMRLSISIGDIFEGRIFPVDKEWWFTSGFCFHPKEVKKFILDEIKKSMLGELHEKKELILNLAGMRLKYERYHHIQPEKIYVRTKVAKA